MDQVKDRDYLTDTYQTVNQRKIYSKMMKWIYQENVI